MKTRFIVLFVAMLLTPMVHAAAESATLFKNPGCLCCDAYANYLESHGYDVTVKPVDDLPRIKALQRVPDQLAGCHTILIGDYVVEGHVPVAAVDRLLEQEPPVRGIAVPGMPAGSPGMPGELNGPLAVKAFGGGENRLFGYFEP